jgi:hypothetical protein
MREGEVTNIVLSQVYRSLSIAIRLFLLNNARAQAPVHTSKWGTTYTNMGGPHGFHSFAG